MEESPLLSVTPSRNTHPFPFIFYCSEMEFPFLWGKDVKVASEKWLAFDDGNGNRHIHHRKAEMEERATRREREEKNERRKRR